MNLYEKGEETVYVDGHGGEVVGRKGKAASRS
jgi:hypothetical protein